MSHSISSSRTEPRSANRWCQLITWATIVLVALPLKAGILDSEIITYQGHLLLENAPLTGTVSMDFRLYTNDSGGSLVASQSIPSVPVSAGLFQVELLFGSQPYETGLWLEIEADNIVLAPRQRVAAVPLALHSLNGGDSYWDLAGGFLNYGGAVAISTSDPEALTVSGDNIGVMSTANGSGVVGQSNTGTGVQGIATDTSSVNYGLYGTSFSESGFGMFATNIHEFGTAIRAEGFRGLVADADSIGLLAEGGDIGVYGESPENGVYGVSPNRAVSGFANDEGGYGGYFTGVAGSSSYFSHQVGIGTNDPLAMLHVEGLGDAFPQQALRVSVGDDEKLVVGGLGTSIYQNVFVDGTVAITSFAPGGGINVCRTSGSTGVLAACSSSGRYKTDIASLDSTTTLIERLRPVSYRWTESGEEDFGLVAEEVAEIEPRLVTYNPEGQVEGVKYRQLSALLIRALQEQHHDIDRLQAEIRELTQQVDHSVNLARHNEELSDRVDRLEAVLLQRQPVASSDYRRDQVQGF